MKEVKNLIGQENGLEQVVSRMQSARAQRLGIRREDYKEILDLAETHARTDYSKLAGLRSIVTSSILSLGDVTL